MTRRWPLVVLVYAVLIGGGWLIGHWLSTQAVIDVRAINEPEIHSMVMAVSALYVATSAMPFVPGAEIGLAMIAMLGSRIAFLVYICMVGALTLSFSVGRFVPPHLTARLFGALGMERARDGILKSAALSPAERIELLVEHSPRKWVPFLLRHRYIAVGLAFNLPGNTLLGGGGGIALAAGMSGLFSFVPFVLMTALAVAPVPLFILLTGYQP